MGNMNAVGSAHRLVPGHTLAAVMEVGKRRVRQYRDKPDKLAALQAWLFAFTRHVAHGLSQMG